MQKTTNIKRGCKAVVICLMTALLFSLIVIFIFSILFNDKLSLAEFALNSFHDSSENTNNEIKVENINGKRLIKSYPFIGQKYARIKIESVGVDLPVYFGDNNDILRKGVGHYSGSYFPGECGSIIYCAHHSFDKFGKLQNIKVNDVAVISTDYGDFSYTVYDIKVINETDFHLLPIQKEKEKLMLYTCYPFGYLGLTKKRFVVYFNLNDYEVGDDDG